jgi:hypothetical protein
MMKIGKNMIIAIMITFCFTASLFIIIPIRSATSPYDPMLDYNHDGKISLADLVAIANSYGTTGDPTVNVNVTNWPSQLLSNYVYDSGPFTLGPYPNNDSWTYRDLSIAGYRQVSVFVSFANIQDVNLAIRVGMGNFSGAHPGGYNWATYYNITTITGQVKPPFTQTIDVRGPQLTIEIYNSASNSQEIEHIAVYATC